MSKKLPTRNEPSTVERHRWLRVTNGSCWPVKEGYTKVGDILAIILWRDDGAPIVRTDKVDFDFVLCQGEWEPHNPHPPKPTYVPKVGDIVTWGDRIIVYEVWIPPQGGYVPVKPRDKRWPSAEPTYVRINNPTLSLATPEECAAAGLLDVASSTDREGLQIALINAVSAVEHDLWENFNACHRRSIVVDAVLPVVSAHLKAATVTFDENKEREAANDAYLDDDAVDSLHDEKYGYVAGWLARARLANGEAS